MHRGTIVALDRPGTLLASRGAELIELRVADNPDGSLRLGGADYSTFGTVGLLIPLTCTFAGIGVIVDRASGARRELLAAPVVVILPWFLAGSLFPITALPGWLAWAARILPTTHALALLRYGVLDHADAGLQDIWGFTSTTTEPAPR